MHHLLIQLKAVQRRDYGLLTRWKHSVKVVCVSKMTLVEERQTVPIAQFKRTVHSTDRKFLFVRGKGKFCGITTHPRDCVSKQETNC